MNSRTENKERTLYLSTMVSHILTKFEYIFFVYTCREREGRERGQRGEVGERTSARNGVAFYFPLRKIVALGENMQDCSSVSDRRRDYKNERKRNSGVVERLSFSSWRLPQKRAQPMMGRNTIHAAAGNVGRGPPQSRLDGSYWARKSAKGLML